MQAIDKITIYIHNTNNPLIKIVISDIAKNACSVQTYNVEKIKIRGVMKLVKEYNRKIQNNRNLFLIKD